jgi:flagellar biosynthesis/type III secretory pathway protein FliH
MRWFRRRTPKADAFRDGWEMGFRQGKVQGAGLRQKEILELLKEWTSDEESFTQLANAIRTGVVK